MNDQDTPFQISQSTKRKRNKKIVGDEQKNEVQKIIKDDKEYSEHQDNGSNIIDPIKMYSHNINFYAIQNFPILIQV